MKGTIKKTLGNIGLSEKESEVYIFLGTRGPLKGSHISKYLKMNKGQVYRILKGLQKNGLVEATLEYPTRFTAVPFENVIESFIKSKRHEVHLIEDSKDQLLSDWKKISQTELESSLERFSVIEGKKKIFQKMSQMVKEADTNFSCVLAVSDLIAAEQNGVFSIQDSKESKIGFRGLTQLSKQNLIKVRHLQTVLPPEFDLRSRNCELCVSFLPRVVIRDNDEILLFISDSDFGSTVNSMGVCLSTNCKCIIQSFISIFEDCWSKSAEIENKINEIETGKFSPVMDLIKDSKTAKKFYYDRLYSAKKEILMVASTKRLIGISKNIELLKNLQKDNVSIKIMAPITFENLDYAKQLLENSEVKHIPVGYRETTIIDDQYLFQFNTPCENETEDCEFLNT
ncbi:MAG: helix-turn-helix domain-containing protein [Candidatus Bathyarchaeota archaeon]